MDGFELAELLRGSERTRHIPLIFVTAGASDAQRVFKGYESGAVDFLVKPIDPRILQSKAAVFFELYRTKLRLARELAERTETLRLHETFAAVLGHDLRTPLNLIQLAALYVQMNAADGPMRGKAEQIMTASKTMARMIADLLDVSGARLGGGLSVAPARVDAGALVERVVAEQRAVFPAARIEAERRGDLGAEWDAERVVQLLTNLVGNALRHGSAEFPVQVAADGSAAGEIVLRVANRGTIPPEFLAQLFEPFRTRSAASAAQGGLGLGLFIVREIARAHGGSVQVACDGGTIVFTARLPRRLSAR